MKKLLLIIALITFIVAVGNNRDVVQKVLAANVAPAVTIVTPTNNQQFPAPAAVQISGSASDGDGTIKHISITTKDSAGQQKFNREISRDPGNITETFDSNNPILIAW